MKGPFSTPDGAIKDFEKKFKDKTQNKWADRASFKPVAGKYTLLEMAGDDGEDDVDAVSSFEFLCHAFRLELNFLICATCLC